MATDYDNGDITKREKTAAKRQKSLNKYNQNTLTQSTKNSNASSKNIANWSSNQQTAIQNQQAKIAKEVARDNALNAYNQWLRSNETYDMANEQNRNLLNTEAKQFRRKSEEERFEARRNLQNAALGLLGSMNQAMNGSTLGNAMYMFRDRNDADNDVYWQQLQDNLNTIQNAYDESYNQNQIAKKDAANNVIKAIQDIANGLSGNLGNIQGDLYANLSNIRADLLASLASNENNLYTGKRNLQGDLAANLNNINPNLYEAPENIKSPGGYKIPDNLSRINGMDSKGKLTNTIYEAPGSDKTISKYENRADNAYENIKANNPKLLDYLMPAVAEQSVLGYRNRLKGNDYFSRLVNGFNF